MIRPKEAAAAVQMKPPPAINNTKTPAQNRPRTAAPTTTKQPSTDHDDDDDVRSGVNQPVSQRPKPSNELPTPSVVVQSGGVGKELTPKEKMLLNKLKKADEAGAVLG